MPTLTAPAAARALIECTSHTEATTHAAQLRGAQLAAVAALLGVTVYGPVTRRREQLVQHTIGVALSHTAIAYHGEPAAQAEYLTRWRARRLAQLPA